MSRENVEIVRRVFDAFSRGDLEGQLDAFAPGLEFHTSGRFVDMRPVYRGREGLDRVLGRLARRVGGDPHQHPADDGHQ